MKKLFLIAAIAASVFSIYSCKKNGCTDPKATNYNSSASSNDGSCQYQGSIVFWWNQTTKNDFLADSLTATSILFYVNGTQIGSVTNNSSAPSWPSAPSCGATGT